MGLLDVEIRLSPKNNTQDMKAGNGAQQRGSTLIPLAQPLALFFQFCPTNSCNRSKGMVQYRHSFRNAVRSSADGSNFEYDNKRLRIASANDSFLHNDRATG